MEFDSEKFNGRIKDIQVKDIRFPTSLDCSGSDALHVDPDYSCAYVIINTTDGKTGYGLTFTIGRGTEIVVKAVESLSSLVFGRKLKDIFENFGVFWGEIASDTQLCWIGPEKGVIHLATAAIINALWDLWARIEEKPLWKLLCDMDPELLLSTLNTKYITDVLSSDDILSILKKFQNSKSTREQSLREHGYPAYCTSVGWLYYSDDKVRELCHARMREGFTAFKAKVGLGIESDRRRIKLIREVIGNDNLLMLDANQVWDVPEAIENVKGLREFKPLWIEEPTSPDDVLGHATIAKGVADTGIAVATGEQCSNRVLFKQMFQSNALQYCQPDCCRLGGFNEVLTVYLMAAKFGVPVCPHAGGVGLCELIQHISMWDYVCVTGTTKNRMIEYVEHLHENFESPVLIINGRFRAPTDPGSSSKLKEEAIEKFEYPKGSIWKQLFSEGKYPAPYDDLS